jgi:hypothetical protein
MDSLLEMIATCTERGKADRNTPYPPDLKGQDGADELAAKALANGVDPNRVLSEGLMLGMFDARILRQNRGGPLFQRSAIGAAISVRRV